MRLKLLAFTACAIIASGPSTSAAASITYTPVSIQIGPEVVELSFTTDGTLGTLTSLEHLINFEGTVSDRFAATAHLTLIDFLVGGSLTATSTTISYQFGNSGEVTFQGPDAAYVLLSNDYIAAGNDASLAHGFVMEPPEFFALGVSAAPEPSSWAMMIMGITMIGAMLRRRRSLAVT